MMPVIKAEVRPGAYYDSLVLMELQRSLLKLPGVVDAGVVMATQANRELLAVNMLLPDAIEASPDDLLIVVKADSESAASAALGEVDALLTRRRSAAAQDFRPRSLRTAFNQLLDAGWVLVSVPGQYAAEVARQALELDRHCFIYSDNVPLEDEVELKQIAREKGLLVMGPDCGTAIINGVGLGFANRIRRGPIGLVGASGTGLQAITTRIHNLGEGVSHAIGTGGRDLKAKVGAITSQQGLDILARDPETRVIVLVSKPPDLEVAARLLARARTAGKPVVVDFIGYPPPGRQVGNLHFAASLDEAAQLAVELASKEINQVAVSEKPVKGYLRGLFSGGTLAYEALLRLQAFLAPIYSNVPISPEQKMQDPLRSQGHAIIDLGSDEFTVGRLHPMIDNDLRIRHIRQEAADPDTGMIMLDIVLGEGAHADPASELAPVIQEIKAKSGIEVVAVVIGTENDPQDEGSQTSHLKSAGANVFRDLSSAVDYVSQRFRQRVEAMSPPVSLDSLTRPLAAINVGLELFYESLLTQGAQAVHVDWRPPAGGDERMRALLEKMKK